MTAFLVEETIDLSSIDAYVTRDYVLGFIAAGGRIDTQYTVVENTGLFSSVRHFFIKLNGVWFRYYDQHPLEDS